jgi:transposase
MPVKSLREQMDIVNAYAELGSYRAVAALYGTTHRTVKQIVERRERQVSEGAAERERRERKADTVQDLIRQRVAKTDGRISAKRLLPIAQAAGYTGSARSFRRAVAEVKQAYGKRHRVYRPWRPEPGEHLVIDWGVDGQRHVFCAVLAWSRYRFVRFATDERRETTLRLLAECLAELGGVPGVVLADRMGCLRGGIVADVVVPHLDYVRMATHYNFRADFCQGYDPESKGVVEALVGYVKRDLMATLDAAVDLVADNGAARTWCAEVNGQVHSEIAAIPLERLAVERPLLRPLPTLDLRLRDEVERKVDKMGTIRFGSARYSVPQTLRGRTVRVWASEGEVIISYAQNDVARHRLVAPGEVALNDAHYGKAATRPARAIRPRTAAEVSFVAYGEVAEGFLRAAAAAGTTRLESELRAIVAMESTWGRDAVLRALERAVHFRRFTANDVRQILAAGAGVQAPTLAGEPLNLVSFPSPLPPSLDAYAIGKAE